MASSSHHGVRINCAYQPRLPSASTASGNTYSFGPLIKKHAESENLESFDSLKSGYDLNDLALHLHTDFDLQTFKSSLPKKTRTNIGEVPSRLNEHLAKYCVELCSHLKLEFKVDNSVEHLNELSPFCCTTRERPDVAVYQDGKLRFTVEVHSSPFSNTLRKTIIGCIDMIRLFRNADPSFSTFTAFVFPKLHTQKTVVVVTVTFESLVFMYSLRSVAMANVMVEIDRILQCPTPPEVNTVDDNFLVKLSDNDLHLFPNDSQQLPSRHSILVECKSERKCYKLFSNFKAISAISKFMLKLKESPLNHFVQYETEEIKEKTITTYNRITHDPLSEDEAVSCLSDLVPKIKAALDELHSCGFAHNDVRLPNICFSDSCEPVFIDLDESSSAKDNVLDANSCMYRKPPGLQPKLWRAELSDLVQLGWLAAYICDPSQTDYHAMTFKGLSTECQNDGFLKRLLENGEYCKDKLRLSIISRKNTKTVKDVIHARQK